MERHCLVLSIVMFLHYTSFLANAHRFIQGTCSDGFVMCQTGTSHNTDQTNKGCIKKRWICDGGQPDCNDRSDENYCPYDFNFVPEVTTEILPTTARARDVFSDIRYSLREVPLFSLRVAIKMKQLDPKTYLQAERLINQVLFEAQMGNLTYFTELFMHNKYINSLDQQSRRNSFITTESNL